MLFDDPAMYSQLDPQDMRGEIARLPDQLAEAQALSRALPLPAWTGLTRVVIAGMGGSAIGADLLAAHALPDCRVPVFVHRDYGLPGWAAGPETLVIASSHSGNTEETLSAFEAALAAGCRVLAVCTGGRLAAAAEQAGIPVWRFVHAGQPRAAVGFSFGLLLGAFERLGLLPNQGAEIEGALEALRGQGASLAPEVPAVANPAKRYAGQLMGRSFTVFGAEFLGPVARRWKGQVNELAKSWAQFEILPEADHNALAGTVHPESLTMSSFAMFLTSPLQHPRNRLRMELTRRAYMLEGVSTDFYEAHGAGRLAQQWTALQFADYVSYYLALACGVDPTPVAALEAFKEEMAGTQ